MPNLTALHVNWTAPAAVRGAKKCRIEDHELLTTVLSALNWRRDSGRIIMVADRTAAEYYRNLQLTDLWDSLDDTLDVPPYVSPISYWAAGKFFALWKYAAPVCLIDTDFIIWEKLSQLTDFPLTVAHFEETANDIYPDRLYYQGLSADFDRLDWTLPACNTAFCCFSDDALRRAYLEFVFKFLKSAVPNGNTLQYMVCVEQRLLSMVAAAQGIVPHPLLTSANWRSQTACTHTWGYKQTMRADKLKQIRYCVRLARRITQDYPDWADRLRAIPQLAPYFAPKQPFDQRVLHENSAATGQ